MNEPSTRPRSAGPPPAGESPRAPTPLASEDTELNEPVTQEGANPPGHARAPSWEEGVLAGVADSDEASIREMSSTQLIGGDGTPSTPAADSRPVRMGDFELIQKLGEGAMGAVYRARQVSFGRQVALKVLFPHVARNPKLVERLYREARAMALLDHPNIVQAYAVGEDQGCHYVAMEFVEGQNLQKWVARVGRVNVGHAVHIVLVCARALAYAHRQGMVHRDIKPENILLTPSGEIKVADLGMVKNFDDDMSLTQTGHAVGTPWYMPLEQARNAKDTDGRSDIYALGCTLYCLLTGSPPFAGGTIIDVIRAKEQGTFPSARSVNPEIPERLDLIIAKMTAKQPRYRYQKCDEVVADLEGLGLASSSLDLPGPAAQADRPPGSSSGEVVKSDAPEETPVDPAVWYVRMKGPGGQTVLRKYTTEQLQKRLADASIDPRIKASHSAKDGFRALATYREFEGTAMSRASKEAADKSTVQYRNLYKKIDEQDRRREEAEHRRRTEWPPWLTTALTLGMLVLGAVLLIAFLYWVVTNLVR